MEAKEEIRKHIKTIEKYLFCLFLCLFFGSLYVIFIAGYITSGLTALLNTLFWSAYYLIKRRDFEAWKNNTDEK